MTMSSSLRTYEENFDRLMTDKTFRDELVFFSSLKNDSAGDSNMTEVVPVLIRYGIFVEIFSLNNIDNSLGYICRNAVVNKANYPLCVNFLVSGSSMQKYQPLYLGF